MKSMFPEEFNRTINEKEKSELQAAYQNNDNQTKTIERKKLDKPSFFGTVFSGIMIGFVAGIISCTGVCFAGNSGYTRNFEHGIEWGVYIAMGIIILSVIIAVLSLIAYGSSKTSSNKKLSEVNKEYADIKAETQGKAEKARREYNDEFEAEVQSLSVKFAESTLAKEVIAWMTEGFIKTINAADRRSHVEKIIVPFIFNVYQDKITCNLGTYDFKLKRCANLTGPVEQTALARVLATALQLNIIMEYPKDASGTDISININYRNNFADVRYTSGQISYVAPNGNYEAVKSWEE